MSTVSLFVVFLEWIVAMARLFYIILSVLCTPASALDSF